MGASDKYLVVIAGPTAVGKTRTAIEVARALETEIVSADSRQVFREMTIGTAKPSVEEQSLVKHHFIDSHSIHAEFNAAQYAEATLTLLAELLKEHNYVVMCGGSGLYIQAVCSGFDDIPQIPSEVRDHIRSTFEARGLSWLQEELAHHDPTCYEQIDIHNPHRLMRALEVKVATGTSLLDYHGTVKKQRDFSIIKIGLELEREILYRRIDDRMDQMIARGLFEEAASLVNYNKHNALQTVGYQEIFEYLAGKYDREEAIRLLKRNSRRYAKRQLTWFKRDSEYTWFHPEKLDEILDYITAKSH